MLLSQLIEPLPAKHLIGSANPDVDAIVYDSRRVTPGALFVCIRGGKFDGHEFIFEAVGRGARAVVADRPDAIPDGQASVPLVIVSDTRQALPILANRFFGYPSRRLKLVGVTGTNGKTTTTYLVESVLRHAGLPTGVIGTLGAMIRGRRVAIERTTPESVDLQKLLADMAAEGVEAAAMEVSSHALAMHRTDGCEYDIGVFTNLTQDHLDFHSSLDEYLQAKLKLFSEYPAASAKHFTAVINADDPSAERVKRATRGSVLTYGAQAAADVRAADVRATASGVSFRLCYSGGEFDVRLSLGGFFNVHNSLAAAGVGIALGLSADQLRTGLQAVPAVAGRFEAVNCGQDFIVIVDYAHTPDGLENVLRSARELTSGRLIAVFGCGGDRDRGKRPLMGRIGSGLADLCIITSDNPRSEPPEKIINEVLSGVAPGSSERVEAVVDRAEAIERALEAASAGDLVVIAGKGHETTQTFKDRTIPFDDRQVVRELLSCSRSKDRA